METAEVSERMKAEREGASERYPQVLLSTQRIVKARDERKDMTVDTLTTLRLLYKQGLTVAALVQLVDVFELRRRVTKWEGELEVKVLQLQMLPVLAEKNATMLSKLEMTRTEMTSLHSESDAVFMMMFEILALRIKTEGVVTKVTSLIQRELELEAALRQGNKHSTAAEVREKV